MALLAMPIVYMNLGGEMLYVLEERLIAQAIPTSRSYTGAILFFFRSLCTVLDQVVSAMFNEEFLNGILQPQQLYSQSSLRAIFDKVSQCSVMRLNAASMDKVWIAQRSDFKPCVNGVWRKHTPFNPSMKILVMTRHIDFQQHRLV